MWLFTAQIVDLLWYNNLTSTEKENIIYSTISFFMPPFLFPHLYLAKSLFQSPVVPMEKLRRIYSGDELCTDPKLKSHDQSI